MREGVSLLFEMDKEMIVFLTFLIYQQKNHPNIVLLHPNIVLLLDAKAKPLATSTEAACFTFCLRILLLIYHKMTNDDRDSSLLFKVL